MLLAGLAVRPAFPGSRFYPQPLVPRKHILRSIRSASCHTTSWAIRRITLDSARAPHPGIAAHGAARGSPRSRTPLRMLLLGAPGPQAASQAQALWGGPLSGSCPPGLSRLRTTRRRTQLADLPSGGVWALPSQPQWVNGQFLLLTTQRALILHQSGRWPLSNMSPHHPIPKPPPIPLG